MAAVVEVVWWLSPSPSPKLIDRGEPWEDNSEQTRHFQEDETKVCYGGISGEWKWKETQSGEFICRKHLGDMQKW